MPKRNTASAVTREKFTGHERDNEVGLDYMVWRRYDPALGRFLSVDPMADNYPSWSPYNYALNNPLRFNDPTGMCPEEFGEKICSFLNQFEAFRAFFAQPKDDSDAAVQEVVEQKERAGMLASAMKEGGELIQGMIDIYSSLPGLDVAFKGAEGDLEGTVISGGLYFVPGGKLLKPLGRGSTGRNVPKNLTEQLAMKEIMSNPASGRVIQRNLNDQRWNGWVKMSNRNAHGVEIHYNVQVRNGRIINIDDIKFVDP